MAVFSPQIMKSKPSYPLAIFEAVFVNIIWASSFIFVKLLLKDLGPLTIGGLRYFIGFLVLLPFMLRRGRLHLALPRRIWLRLLLIGVSAYTIGNGAMFWSLKYLPATTVSFMMSIITLLVLFGGILWLKEIPTWLQAVGILVTLGGTALFFLVGLKPGEPLGMAILSLGLVSFTLFGVLGREAARKYRAWMHHTALDALALWFVAETKLDWAKAHPRDPELVQQLELEVLPALSMSNVRELLKAVMPLDQLSPDEATRLVIKHLVNRSNSTRSRLNAQRRIRAPT